MPGARSSGVEHPTFNRMVDGSNPSGRTNSPPLPRSIDCRPRAIGLRCRSRLPGTPLAGITPTLWLGCEQDLHEKTFAGQRVDKGEPAAGRDVSALVARVNRPRRRGETQRFCRFLAAANETADESLPCPRRNRLKPWASRSTSSGRPRFRKTVSGGAPFDPASETVVRRWLESWIRSRCRSLRLHRAA